MNNGEKVDLEFPLTIDKNEVKALYLRRPTVKDLIATEKATGTETEQEITMLAKLTGVNTPELEALDLKDYNALNEKVAGFLSSSLKTSDKQ